MPKSGKTARSAPHRKCPECGKPGKLVLTCTLEGESNYRSSTWLCKSCAEPYEQARAAREAAVNRLIGTAAGRDARNTALLQRQSLLHGHW